MSALRKPLTNKALRNKVLSTVFGLVWSPSTLFAANENGVWYDPSDFSTMFQDSAGTTPVTAVEQPVGLILDKSKGLAVGPELVTNGTFNSDLSGWTVGSDPLQVIPTWSAGAVSLTRGTGGAGGFSQTISITTGKWYALSFNLVSGNVTIGGFTGASSISTLGQQTRYVPASGTPFAIWPTNLSSTVVIDNISVKEIAGNHASQSTAASRPVLSARVNLLTYSEQFDNAAWNKTTGGTVTATVSANAGVAPDGATTADLIYPATTGVANVTQSLTTPAASLPLTATCCFKASGLGFGYIQLNGTGGTTVATLLTVNLSNGTLGTVTALAGGGLTATSSSVSSLGSGWYRITLSGTTHPTNTGWSVSFGPCDAQDNRNATTSGTNGVLVWGADLRVTNAGVNLPAYQRIAAATDYDTVGFPLYLKFDGTDDSLATGTIDPGSVDKAQVFAGVRKLSDAATGFVVELSTAVATNNGSFFIRAPNGAAANYYAETKGTTQVAVGATGVTAPITNVITLLSDISAPSATFRTNGVQTGSDVTTQGTGNFLAYPLYIGRRAGTSNPYNGHLYGLIVRFGSNLTSTNIGLAETYMNSKTGAY